MKYKHLFGPVLSRRIGISLGVDLVPHKYCSMNCIYCEIGQTSDLKTQRDEYIPSDEIISELNHYLSLKPRLDYITFSGAGEPTLNIGIGAIINFLKSNYPHYKLALITNSTLLSDRQLRSEVKEIDLIMPSLDAASNEAFNEITRSHKEICLKNVIEGLNSFRQESKAQMWLEVFIVPGINDSKTELTLLKEAISMINPDRVQLNSLDRPGTESWVKKASDQALQDISKFFAPLNVEIIARKSVTKHNDIDSKLDNNKSEGDLIKERIVTTLRRRPCTAEELATVFHSNTDGIIKLLKQLISEDELVTEERETGVFYKIKY